MNEDAIGAITVCVLVVTFFAYQAWEAHCQTRGRK